MLARWQHAYCKKAVPAETSTDAAHIAVGALHEIQLIASWNFWHIVAGAARRNIELELELELELTEAGAFVPVNSIPEEILESLK